MQKLLVPFEMRGYQGVYNLEKKVHEMQKFGVCVSCILFKQGLTSIPVTGV